MTTRRVGPIITVCLALATVSLAPCGAVAGDRQPDDFLSLDLPDAVMSPDPLGPPAQFQPHPGAAATAAAAGTTTGAAGTASNAGAARRATPANRVAAVLRHRIERHRHGNPLDAQASAPRPRIQRWPCHSGGICAWQSRSPR